MARQRRTFSADFKARVALEAIREQKTINELASEFGVHPNLIREWKKHALDELPQVFSSRKAADEKTQEQERERMFQQIGQLQSELAWLKKKPVWTVEQKRAAIEPAETRLSVRRQCKLLGLSRGSWYYEPVGESEENLRLMRLLDEQYTKTPFYGIKRMTAWLQRQGENVNEKRVRRLLRTMGLMALCPGPKTSQPASAHRIYPYLLREVAITRPDFVWSTDITYIRLARGFGYLVAIMDWFSRYVVAWRLSNSLETHFCLEALEEALEHRTPTIFNTDQGAQFTSLQFTSRLEQKGVQISMDGRGRALDNVFVERLWRSVKWEEVYTHDYQTMQEAWRGLHRYFVFYNRERPHQALGYLTPAEVYFQPELSTR